ncbi:hypothetical protein E2F50_19570 [Rhizobium deserti]|uniref:Uncharacterized protein n=1 Tax=Rhizobium deserti TaxID=2547961 RepID=A0A4R5UAM1_9HYPH|nr:hypothetical protein [Rhizobium deserti]TDK31860.1 hypothetical protein E2F50_19570 [Rhizobium deserti]
MLASISEWTASLGIDAGLHSTMIEGGHEKIGGEGAVDDQLRGSEFAWKAKAKCLLTVAAPERSASDKLQKTAPDVAGRSMAAHTGARGFGRESEGYR